MFLVKGISRNDVTLLDSSANVTNMMSVDDSKMSENNIWTASKIDDTFQKKTTATVGSLLTVDETGNIVGAGIIPGYETRVKLPTQFSSTIRGSWTKVPSLILTLQPGTYLQNWL